MKINSLTIYPQTILALVSYVIFILSIFLPPLSKQKEKDSYNVKKRMIFALLCLLPCIVSIYSIQCMITGKCGALAWYNSIIVFTWCVFTLIFCLKN